jgi:DNA adenine methylase
VKPPLSYYGGRRTLASRILGFMPPHRLYCEPFLGGAAIFFAKVEIVNDTNGELINFYEAPRTGFPIPERRLPSASIQGGSPPARRPSAKTRRCSAG